MKRFEEYCDEVGIELVYGGPHTKEILKAADLYAADKVKEAIDLARYGMLVDYNDLKTYSKDQILELLNLNNKPNGNKTKEESSQESEA